MRELHLTITCDSCGKVLEEAEATVVTLCLVEERYETDVCSSCLRDMVTPLRPAPPKKRKAAPTQEFSCLNCPRKFGSQRGLTKHVQSAHLSPHPLSQGAV